MIPAGDLAADDQRGTLRASLPTGALAGEQAEAFTRADLVFFGVDHSDDSYEVRVFLDNPEATADTPRSPEEGYAGRFVVFGHGGCFGGVGHCDVPGEPRDAHDLRLPHALTPHTKLVTVTDALRRILGEGAVGSLGVTLVPVSKGPARDARGPSPELFRFDGLELRTYLSEDEAEEEDAFA